MIIMRSEIPQGRNDLTKVLTGPKFKKEKR